MKEFQKAVLEWAVQTFGPSALQLRERALRFTEEAVELACACGLTEDEINRVVGRTFSRPNADAALEASQSLSTLAALAEVLGVDVMAEAQHEYDRVKRIPKSEWASRQNSKADAGIGARIEEALR